MNRYGSSSARNLLNCRAVHSTGGVRSRVASPPLGRASRTRHFHGTDISSCPVIEVSALRSPLIPHKFPTQDFNSCGTAAVYGPSTIAEHQFGVKDVQDFLNMRV